MAGERVLIVEDDRTLLEGLEYSLSKEGYTVSTATDGVEALEIARKERPELIILDIMLPELDGLEVCCIPRREGMAFLHSLPLPENYEIALEGYLMVLEAVRDEIKRASRKVQQLAE